MKKGLVAVGLLAAGIAQAGAAELRSVATWGGPQSELVEGTAVDANGAVYVAGTTFSFSDPETEFGSGIFLIKYNADGSLAWQRRWADPAPFFSDSAGDVAVDGTGVYVVGTTVVTNNGNNVLLLKFDFEGNLLWQKTWGGTDQDTGAAIVVGSDGGIYVAGTSGFDAPRAVLVKFAPDGAVVWQQSWTRAGGTHARALAADGNGNVYLAGTSFRPDFFFDTVLLKFDAVGVLQGQAAYAVSEVADALGLAVGLDGSVYVVGSLDGAASAFVVKFAADFSLDWQRAIGGRSGDRANAVTVAADGTVWVAGETNTADASDEAFVVQFSDRGRLLQANTWGGVEIEHGIDLGFGPDGILNVGAIAQAPPWVFTKIRLRSSRLRGAVNVPPDAAENAVGVVADAAGVVSTPAGSTEYAGASDAALLKIAP